jgi:diguanylate cyclase (GGDEF)-like protein
VAQIVSQLRPETGSPSFVVNLPLEPLHLPTLTLVIGVVLFTAASIMTLVGATQRTYRGFWWWTAAQWGNMASAICLLMYQVHPWFLPISTLLSLQWPLTMLAGTRQFYARTNFRTPQWTDLALLLAGFAVYFTIWQENPDDIGARVATFSLINITNYGYTAWQVHSIRDWRQSPYLKTILFLLCVAVVVQVPRMLAAFGSWGAPVVDSNHIQQPVVLIGLVAGVMFSVYMCLLLTYERTEQDLRESHRQLRVLADFDMLTQVPNRRHFNEMAQQTLRLSPPGRSSLMVFNIDHFKQINEESGHAGGDEALKLVAGTARKLLRSRDLLGRLGGDEFVALLPDTSTKDALHVADRMVRHLDRERRVLHQKPLSLSFGVVQIAANETMTDATHRADLALQQAKQQGRGRAVAGDPMPVLSARAADLSAAPDADAHPASDMEDPNDTEASQRRRSSDLGDGAQG